MKQLYSFKDKHGNDSPLISKSLYDTVMEHGDELDNMIDYNNDYLIDYFGFKTLERAYLMKVNGITVERPQHMWLRVSMGIHGNNLEKKLKKLIITCQTNILLMRLLLFLTRNSSSTIIFLLFDCYGKRQY